MKFYIFVFGLLLNLTYCFSIKLHRNGHVNQRILSVPTSPPSEGITINMDSVEILKAPNKLEHDKKSYRLIRLSNGLTALLVSTQEDTLDKNENNKTSAETRNVASPRIRPACDLHVDVGSFSDPRDVQGLAHFVGEFDVSSFTFKGYNLFQIFFVPSNRTHGIQRLEKVSSRKRVWSVHSKYGR